MAQPLEEWSVFDHLRFLARASVWLVGAMLIAGTVSWGIASSRSVTHAEALLQLGKNPVNGWLEPPAELAARCISPTFLHGISDGRPAGSIPLVAAKKMPNSGVLRLKSSGKDKEAVQWAIRATADKVIRDHGERADRAAIAIERRITQLDQDIDRLVTALALPHDSTTEIVTERMRLVLRLGRLERERDDMRPEVRVTSPRRTRLVQPATISTVAQGPRQAIYGGTGGFLFTLTVLYLRLGLKLSRSVATKQ